MDRKRMTYFAFGFGLLLLVVVGLLARSSFREPAGIVLPEDPAGTGALELDHLENQLNVIAISPETLRPAVATLSRPLSYSRTQTVETFWSGGSGQAVYQVSVSGNRTRLDTRLADGSVRHTLAVDGESWVWYDSERLWTVLRGGDADQAARMPTYETVLDLPEEKIAVADYRMKDGLYCIYVETTEDEAGYADRYWISVGAGLLASAERVCAGKLVYRFSASPLEAELPAESLFLLPDGSTPGDG
ncbi:MAG: hypothetical protein K2O18_07450 [Oscillospiraceae bacterium]|nr:hypothetical protein [Oscillospiraceae bacterium]